MLSPISPQMPNFCFGTFGTEALSYSTNGIENQNCVKPKEFGHGFQAKAGSFQSRRFCVSS